MASESKSWWRGARCFEQDAWLIPGCRSHSVRVSVRLWYSFCRMTQIDGTFWNKGSAPIWKGGIGAAIPWLSRWLLVLKFQARIVWVPQSYSREAWVLVSSKSLPLPFNKACLRLHHRRHCLQCPVHQLTNQLLWNRLTKSLSIYDILAQVGEGTFGKVYIRKNPKYWS